MTASDAQQSRALSQFMDHYEWKKFAVLLEPPQLGMNSIQDFLNHAISQHWDIAGFHTFSYPTFNATLDVRQQLQSIKTAGK